MIIFFPQHRLCREMVAAAIERKHLELGEDGGLKGVIEVNGQRIKGILAADGEITTYAVWILQYLAKRCESLAAISGGEPSM